MSEFTIDDLKRALVEVRDICAASWVDCVKCPLFNQNAFECPIQNRFPSNWEVDHWKEDGKDENA